MGSSSPSKTRRIADTDGPHLSNRSIVAWRPHTSAPVWGSLSRAGVGERSRVGGKPSRGRRQVLDPRSGAEPSRTGGVGRVMTRPARILLVDDEPSIQKGLTPLLASRGYEVESAMTGHAALQAFERVPPDLIVLDLGLPDLEGGEVCRRIRTTSQVPIIVLSARGADADKIAVGSGCRRLRHEAFQP